MEGAAGQGMWMVLVGLDMVRSYQTGRHGDVWPTTTGSEFCQPRDDLGGGFFSSTFR